MTQTYCALDLETTGVNPYKDAICEIGIVRFTCSEIIEKYSTLVNPGRPMPEDVTFVHGITDAMVDKAPTIEGIIDSVLAFIDGYPLVIQNPRFDLSFLQLACKLTGRKLTTGTVYDTVSLAKHAFPELRNHKLETVCRHLSVELSFHRALDDAIGCMNIFVHGLQRISDSYNAGKTLYDLCGFNCEENLLKKVMEYSVLAPGKKFLIEYRDKNGIVTERMILTKEIFKQGKKVVVQAFCYLRNEDRFFNFERIKSIRAV
jgi:DNA polymerase III epsilon subunit family exonuclease